MIYWNLLSYSQYIKVRRLDEPQYYYNGVEKGTTLEPYDKKILAKLDGNCNIYRKLVLLIKLDTQAYYNIKMILGLEYK